MFVDRRGDVWFSVRNQGGALQQIHGDTGKIEVHSDALPPLVRWDQNAREDDARLQASRSIYWMPAARRRPRASDDVAGRRHAVQLRLDEASRRGVYAAAPHRLTRIWADSPSAAIASSTNQRKNRAFGNQEFKDFHLLSVSLDAASGYPITDHGLMVDQDGRTAWRTPGMQADGRGHVYMIGDCVDDPRRPRLAAL
jgi:hypothetical protein